MQNNVKFVSTTLKLYQLKDCKHLCPCVIDLQKTLTFITLIYCKNNSLSTCGLNNKCLACCKRKNENKCRQRSDDTGRHWFQSVPESRRKECLESNQTPLGRAGPRTAVGSHRSQVRPLTMVSHSVDSKRAVVSYWPKYVHLVVVNRLGGQSLSWISVVMLTGLPGMAIVVYRGRKITKQHHLTDRRDV